MLDTLLAPGTVDTGTLTDTLLPGPMLDAGGCLAIYQRSYILRLRLCLEEQFPATCHALGQQLFNDFADEYLSACPSDSYTLYELGRRFPAWLEQTRPDRDAPEADRESWIDFMVDLATYERELFRLFDAPGHEQRPWPDQNTHDHVLILQPGLILAQYRYPVAWFYHEVSANRAPGIPPASPQLVAIVRRDYTTTTYPISTLHYRFLKELQNLGRIDRALAAIATWTGESLETVRQSWTAEVRRPWIDAGFFITGSD